MLRMAMCCGETAFFHIQSVVHFIISNSHSNDGWIIIRPVLNRFDSEQKYVDISDFSQSVILYFPHFYHSYADSQISTQPHYRNTYHNQGNYLGFKLFLVFFCR